MKATLLLASAALSVLLASCTPSTPQARIQQAPHLYAQLSSKQKALVERGQISEGMSPNAVYLAWGRPSEEYRGSEHGKSTLRWDYTSSRPVYTSSFWGGYGYGPYYGYRGYYGGYYGGGPEVIYMPYESARVLFINDRVTKWERIN